jgi:hypothetical protein
LSFTYGKIYYPGGFQFPLVPLESSIALVELFREAATIIMLLGIGILSAKTTALRFAHFIFCFAVWDLFYYLFLWIFLGWPDSIFTWDILFLIPIPWVGPVITPCIVSITMAILALSIIHFQGIGMNTRMKIKEWILFIAGSLVIILSFIWDYFRYIHEIKSYEISTLLSDKYNLIDILKDYVHVDFNWPLFLTGESILLYGMMTFIDRIISENMNIGSSTLRSK